MSRSGYSDDCSEWDLSRWRGAVTSAIRGRRGQAFLAELLAALDAMPDKRLITYELLDEKGDVCALGCVARQRGMDIDGIDVEDVCSVAKAFGIARALAAEIEFENDEVLSSRATPEQRWRSVRSWVAENMRSGQDA